MLQHLRRITPVLFSIFLFSILSLVHLSCTKQVRQDDASIITDVESAESEIGESMEDEAAMEEADLSMDQELVSGLQTVYFDYDSFNLRPNAKEALRQNIEWMKANSSASIQIEGHCDERGTIEYNLALGERRANSAKSYLERMGVSGSRMSSISYGEERPANPNSTGRAWAENRRAEFVVLSQ